MNPAGLELVDVVDEAGNRVAVVSRHEMRQRRLPHRCTYLLLFNRAGELFVHLRTATKDVYPSHWDVCVGGVAAAGEAFDQAAVREAREEVGVDVKLEPLFAMRYLDERTVVHGVVYRGTHDGPFHLQPEEVVRGEFLPVPEVEARLRQAPFCPDGIHVLGLYRARQALHADG